MIVNRLDAYGFRDEHGHPLENCRDYHALVAVAEAAQKVFEYYYLWGEDRDEARLRLAALGNALEAVSQESEAAS